MPDDDPCMLLLRMNGRHWVRCGKAALFSYRFMGLGLERAVTHVCNRCVEECLMRYVRMGLVLLALLCAALPALADPFTPGRETCGQPGCFWETPMDVTDEAAMWQMLISPMTVISGEYGDQKYVYGGPSYNDKVVAEVTCRCQGVHVLETLDHGWTRIELYSSSFKGSKSKAWNQLVTGYVPTSWLKPYQVKTKYGFIVDKLTQKLYIFQEGSLYDTLTISTGLPNDRQPYNETRSGEFFMYSRTGSFKSDNLVCDMGIRFNAGDMIHEVPHVVYSNGKSDYSLCASKLGQRASHGCIRVQRKRTPKGTSMQWIWNAIKGQIGTRLVIWEDWPGRTMPMPADDLLLYMESGGKTYHAEATCVGVKESRWPMTAFTYAELEDDGHRRLTRCDYCYPVLRRDEVEAINEAHRLPEGAVPTATPVPTAAPVPTATPVPTTTSTPTAAPAPTMEPAPVPTQAPMMEPTEAPGEPTAPAFDLILTPVIINQT